MLVAERQSTVPGAARVILPRLEHRREKLYPSWMRHIFPGLLAEASKWGTGSIADMDNATRKKRAGNSGAVIYDRLREDILAGLLKPETPLSQSAIAKEAGTSRGPVNEALRRLQQDRLVIARANQRFCVAPFNIMDLEAIFCLHLANNALAVQISVPFLTDEELQVVDEGAALIDESFEQDKAKWEKGYQKILFTLIGHSSTRSVDLARQLIAEMRRHRTLWPNMRPVWLNSSDFKEVIAAARARNGKLASICFAEVMGRMTSLLMAGTDPTYDAFRLRHYIKTMSQADGLFKN